jgi:hypothetical protein
MTINATFKWSAAIAVVSKSKLKIRKAHRGTQLSVTAALHEEP